MLSPVTLGVKAREDAGAVAVGLRSVRHSGERQPGLRRPAPGDLGLVQAFVNSRWDLERDLQDQFTTPASLAAWLAERALLEPGTRLTQAQLTRALNVREGLRAMLFVNNGAAPDPDAIERMNKALAGPGLFARLGPDTAPDFNALRRDFNSALALIGTIVALAQVEGRWARLKACRGHHCGWTFYDHSRNQAGSWCAMSVCGSREKARAYRMRKRSR